ncbi:MAG: ankyrin repeat domain-containing protein [Acetobacteraceae bacterium]|nr:ankyrin repeat domain-containing protein [Acetobacteraceae bacterium]
MRGIETEDLLAHVASGNVERLRALLPARALSDGVLDGALSDGVTPLMLAAAFGHEPMVELLLQCGADPARRDCHGQSAAAYARHAGHTHLAERLGTIVDQEKVMW